MKRNIPITATGIASILAGTLWCTLFLFAANFWLQSENKDGITTFVSLILILITLILVIPGLLAAYYGYQIAQKNPSKRNIRRSVGSLSFIGSFFITSYCTDKLPEDIHQELSGLSFFLATLLAIPVYFRVCRWLFQQNGLSVNRGEFIGKKILTLLAWQLWIFLIQLLEFIAPNKPGFDRVKEAYWELGGFFGSIVVAVLFYKIATKLFVRVDSKAKYAGQATN